jgi:hypothetical protein
MIHQMSTTNDGPLNRDSYTARPARYIARMSSIGVVTSVIGACLSQITARAESIGPCVSMIGRDRVRYNARSARYNVFIARP